MEIEKYLKQLDLSENEIKVYLVLLELGESHIVPIAKKAILPRTTVYQILERLRDDRLISIIEHKSRRVYNALHPRTILTGLRQKREKLDEQVDSFESSMPELLRLYSTSVFQPKVRFFQGDEIRELYNDILEQPIDENWYVGETKMIEDALGARFLKDWIKRRVAKKIKTRAIRVESEEIEDEVYDRKKSYLRSLRYAPKEFKSPTHVLIYGDNVAFITTDKENFGLVITSREYATTMRNWFSQLWQVSGESKLSR